MREILFRGKCKLTGKWEYGDVAHHDNGRVFIRYWYCGTYTSYEVDHSTVGQYIGLTDKNGVKVFEGDIVHIHDTLLQCAKPWHKFDGYVDFMDGSYRIVSGATTHYRWVDYEVEVIGNIHDNPELLEGGVIHDS